MKYITDWKDRELRFTDERLEHIRNDHPEMRGQFDKVERTLHNPDIVVKSRTDEKVKLIYKKFNKTPVTEKFLCVVVKTGVLSPFVITVYFTDTIKAGEVLWRKKK